MEEVNMCSNYKFIVKVYFLIFFSHICLAHNVATPEHLQNLNSLLNFNETQGLHRESMMARFANSRLDEVLFKDSEAKSERLSLEDHKAMIDAIKRFTKQNSGLINFEDYLLKSSPYEAFSVKTKKHIRTEVFSEFESNSESLQFLRWLEKKVSKGLHLESSKVVSLSNPSDSREFKDTEPLNTKILNIITKGRNVSATDNVDLANFLTQLWLIRNKVKEAPQLLSLSAFEAHRLEKIFLAGVQSLAKELKLPSSFTNNMHINMGLPKTTNQNFLRDRIVVYPMNRWQGLFKGIGPGECIRCSSNRFFDVFMPHAIQFGILKDGKEIGYIGIYKVNGKDSDKKYWYIDTIQSPELVSIKGSTKVLSPILLELQKMALSEGAFLAVAPRNHNSTNFFGNKTEMTMLDRLGSNYTKTVAFDSSPINSAVFSFVGASEQSYHQNIFRKSGYSNINSLYDSLRSNNYEVDQLAPLPGLSLNDLKTYNSLNETITNTSISDARTDRLFQFKHLEVSPRNRSELMKIYKEFSLYFLNSRSGIKIIEETLLRHSSKLIPANTILKGDNLPKLTRALILSNENELRNIISELIWFASSAKDAIELMNLFPSGDLSYAQTLTYVLLPKLDNLNFTDWTSIYPTFLKVLGDNFQDSAFSYEILKRLKTQKEFKSVIKIAFGETGEAVLDENQVRYELITSYWSDFLEEKVLTAELLEYGNFLLDRVSSKYDVQIRRSLFKLASSFEDILDIMLLSRRPANEYLFNYFRSIKQAADRIQSNMSEKQNRDDYFENLLKKGAKVLDTLPSEQDIIIRGYLLKEASTVLDVVKIASLSEPPDKKDVDLYINSFDQALERLVNSKDRETIENEYRQANSWAKVRNRKVIFKYLVHKGLTPLGRSLLKMIFKINFNINLNTKTFVEINTDAAKQKINNPSTCRSVFN